MIKMCDLNGDGQIEAEEFQNMVYQEASIHRHDHSKTPSVHGKTKMAEASPSVLREQRNRKQRLKVLLGALEFDTKSMKDIHSNFVLMSDGTERAPGMVDFADFCACTKVPVSKESKELYGLFQNKLFDGEHIDYRFFLISLVSLLAPNLEMKIGFTFEVFDVDGNGLIDTNELMAVVAATQLLRGKALKERVEKIMQLADTDGNGELDFEEFAVCCRRYQTLIFPKI